MYKNETIEELYKTNNPMYTEECAKVIDTKYQEDFLAGKKSTVHNKFLRDLFQFTATNVIAIYVLPDEAITSKTTEDLELALEFFKQHKEYCVGHVKQLLDTVEEVHDDVIKRIKDELIP